MNVHFVEVNGHVGIDDRHSFQEATSGLTLESADKAFIIIVGKNSSARVLIGSEILTLGANTVVHVNYPRPSPIKGAIEDLKLVAGKIWSKFDRNEWKPQDDWNHAIGIRG